MCGLVPFRKFVFLMFLYSKDNRLFLQCPLTFFQFSVCCVKKLFYNLYFCLAVFSNVLADIFIHSQHSLRHILVSSLMYMVSVGGLHFQVSQYIREANSKTILFLGLP